LLKMVRKQRSRGRERVFVCEAEPCGFWIYREITALGLACMVVSPALIPRRAGDHVKTDRRDSERLVSLAPSWKRPTLPRRPAAPRSAAEP